MKQLSRFLTTLVALLAMTTGAWADNPKVKYALTSGQTITSGTTVDVQDGSDVVATITYGETGGDNFTTKATTNASALSGYTAYTEGNGTNGDMAGGTFYTIVPAYDGTIDVAVVLNADKQFYILENGTALEGYNGKTVTSKYYGTYSFDVKSGKSYKIYAINSKVGFYGFEYTYSAPLLLTPDATRTVWTLDAMPAGNVELQVAYYPGMLTLPAASEGGSISVVGMTDTTLPDGFEKDDKGNIYVESGKEFQVKAVPAEGYRLVSLSDGTNTYDVDADGIATITMPDGDADLTLTATFTDKYVITFVAANANTIELGMATVTVDGTDKTSAITDGKLVDVQAGQTVTLTAKQGYKFRSIEAKKAVKLQSITISGVTVYYAEGESWADAIKRDENKDLGLFIREGNRVHHPTYGQLVDSNTQPVLPDAKINANESYKFIN